MDILSSPKVSSTPTDPMHQELRDKAEELESVFLAQMLKTAGVGKAPTSFGGGVGEDQFASFLAEHQARAFAKSGGIGLAEQIFKAMVARQ